MKNIYEYIQLPRTDRQAHLQLIEKCIDRGGTGTYLKGLLAYITDTTMPSGHKIYVCHACHNANCSNPYHIYWGTAYENTLDRIADFGADKDSIWHKMVAKYGLEEARKRQGHGDKSKGGKANAGKPKSAEHKRKISEAIKAKKGT